MESKLKTHVKLKFMKAIVRPTLTAFCKSRAWNRMQLAKVQRAANYAVRRAMGMDTWNMHIKGISDGDLVAAARWETMGAEIRRHTLQWLGHVSRMPIERRPKQMMHGWMSLPLRQLKFWGEPQASWLRNTLRRAEVNQYDWFRQTQDRKGWRKTVLKAFPKTELEEGWKNTIDSWRPWRPLPRRAPGWWGIEQETRWDTEKREAAAAESLTCPVCKKTFAKGNQLRFHYDEEHSVRDPSIATSICYRCGDCKQYFARREQVKKHECVAKARDRRVDELQLGGWMPVRHGPALPPPIGWHIATDGSGKQQGQRKSAGWGVVIFRKPLLGDEPEMVLHAPVVTHEWEDTWLGARELTNNTAELSAIGETMVWLLEEADDGGEVPVEIRFDSMYAANVAQGRWTPSSNEELAIKVQQLTEEVAKKRQLTWTHVYGHTGAHDNELADQAADLGRQGKVSASSRRWAKPREGRTTAKAKAKSKAKGKAQPKPRAARKAAPKAAGR